MDGMIFEFKGATGKIELYRDKAIISHHGTYAIMYGCYKKESTTILFSQVKSVQYKRAGVEGGFIQFSVINNEKICNNIHDIIKDENGITFGIIANNDAEQFKHYLARLISDKPINILKKVNDIQQLNPAVTNEVIIPNVPNKPFVEDNPKMFGSILTDDEKKEHFEMSMQNVVKSKKEIFKERRAELDRQDVIYCPKCLSTQLSVGQKGFGLGKAAAGAFLTGNLLGAAFGAVGSNKVRITCLKCGHQFYPGKK
jgi:hypothetical protein